MLLSFHAPCGVIFLRFLTAPSTSLLSMALQKQPHDLSKSERHKNHINFVDRGAADLRRCSQVQGIFLFLNPASPRIVVFSWRIRAYDFQRVIWPSLALLRCPVVGCSAPLLSFMKGGWDGQEKTAI